MRIALLITCLCILPVVTSLPEGYEATTHATLDFRPTAMKFAPDGRLFVADQQGELRIVDKGSLLSEPFLAVDVIAQQERGLLGIAFHPSFETNGYVYIYYTVAETGRNRVSRFTANPDDPDQSIPGSEVIILDDISGAAGYHNGGALHFADGKLYIAAGDAHDTSNAQDLSVLAGKLLRINPDGTVPSDNPFVNNQDARGEIFAYGLRNPFTFAVHPNGTIYINDVGQNNWEEVNIAVPGANYGWPTCEGECNENPFSDPFYTYSHSGGVCAITGGSFYTANAFPNYSNTYFFADYCAGWIRAIDSTGTVSSFASENDVFDRIVDLKTGPDGALYYLSRTQEVIGKIAYIDDANRAPTVSIEANISRGAAPLLVGFQAKGSDPDGDSLTYTWDFGDGNSSTGANQSHTYKSGAYTATVIVTDQSGSTASASQRIEASTPPNVNLLNPLPGQLFQAGEEIAFAGEAIDAEDGILDSTAYEWTILLLHNNISQPDHHSHPYQSIKDISAGSFQIPTKIHDQDIWYRVIMTVTDSVNVSSTSNVDIYPDEVAITLDSKPISLTGTLDGIPHQTPYTEPSVVGSERGLGAPVVQTRESTIYRFNRWNHTDSRHNHVTTPSNNATYTLQATPYATPRFTMGDHLIINETVAYHTAYASNGSMWHSFDLSGTMRGNWVFGNITGPVPDAKYLAVYSCHWRAGWDCADGRWQVVENRNN